MRSGKSGKGKRGFSSIVGSVFMVLIMTLIASSYFIYTMSENTAYNVAIREKNQLDLSRMSESLQALNTTYTTFNDTNVNVNARVQNIGSTSVQFITVWICVSNSTPWTGYNFRNLTNANVQPGNVYSLDINLTVSGLISGSNSTYSYSYAAWLVTSKGNTVALQQQIVSSTVIISSQVSQGIGSISMDFKAFRYYDFGSGYVSNGTILPSPKISYTIPNSNKTILALQLTNYDNTTRDITLNNNSYVWVITPQAGTVKPAAWNIANVTSGRYINSFSTQTLQYGKPITVYFGPSSPGFASSALPTIVPVFILLFGKIGPNEFGQNIPFVAFNIPS
jgi:hypothetical protein